MTRPPGDLFEAPDTAAISQLRPLAEQLRSAVLGEVVGQPHLIGSDGTLTRMLERGALASLILWGPPGVGKTTIARLLADAAGLRFAALSAVFSGVADLKRAFEDAGRRQQAGIRTLLSWTRFTGSIGRSRMDSCRWSRTALSCWLAPHPRIRRLP